jgi:hypothetical protein
MTNERQISILKSTLNTILLEAKEPIVKAMAQSALDETKQVKEVIEPNAYCEKHKWFGLPNEECPICKQSK